MRVFPVKVMERENSPGKTDKTPLIRWKEGASSDVNEIRRLWRSFPNSFVGVVTGSSSDLYVIDVDDPAAIVDLDLTRGRSVKTNRVDGEHYYFSSPLDGRDVRNSAIDGLDVRGTGGFVVCWHGPPEGTLSPLPELVAEWARSRTSNSGEAAPEIPDIILEGNREQTMVSLAGSMRRRGMSEAGILAALTEENSTRCIPPLEDRDLERIANSVMRYSPSNTPANTILLNALLDRRMLETKQAQSNNVEHEALSGEDDLTQYDLAITASESINGMACWRAEVGEWWVCSAQGHPGIWSKDRREWVQDTVDRIVIAHKPKAQESFASGTGRFLKRKLAVDDSVFDNHPWLLGVQDGVIDLRTGRLLPPDPSLYLTRVAPVVYDPRAECPLWEAHLFRLFEEDDQRVEWFRRAVGCSLIGRAEEKDQIFVYMLGPPGNGKGTAMRALVATLGQDQHAASLNPNDLVAARHLAWMHRLKGCRLAVIEEVKNQSIDVSKLKTLTGADTMVANRMRQEDEAWEPTHTIFMTANHAPVLDDVSGMARRYRPIQTSASLPDSELSTKYEENLREELPGILAWMVRGCLEWQNDGHKLIKLDSSRLLAEQHLEDNDPFLEWSEECVRFVEESWVTRKQAINSYNWWAAGRSLPNLRIGDQVKLYEWIRARNVTEGRRHSERGFTGLEVVRGPC